jgi:GntR family transcriptional regulator/MocR family aminotransferase
VLDLVFSPDRDAGIPMYRQLGDHLRELIGSGRLPPGEKLPATRELAAALGIGRKTASQAYQSLVDEGVLVAHVGQGTFVSAGLRSGGPGARVRALRRPFAWDALFSRAARTPPPAGHRPMRSKSVAYDFRGGRVDADTLPLAALGRAWSRAIRERLPDAANAMDALGYKPLRAQIARALVSRGVHCEANGVLVTSGGQQGLDLVTRMLIDPGDAIAIEQPGYFGAAMTFQAGGARLIGIDVDDQGLRTDVLARALRSKRIKLIYTTPAAQMPTGAVLSDARRRALLELADETQTPILEDDYDSEFRFGDPPRPALKTEDAAGQVIYVGTFSKAFYPGLRLGYVVAAPELLARLALARFWASRGPDLVSQVAVAELLESGAFERHVRKIRSHYAARRAALLEALAESMPEGARWQRATGGLLVWLSLPKGMDSERVAEQAAAEGIAIEPSRAFFIDGRGSGQLALSFANHDPEMIREGIARLGRVVESRRLRRRSA